MRLLEPMRIALRRFPVVLSGGSVAAPLPVLVDCTALHVCHAAQSATKAFPHSSAQPALAVSPVLVACAATQVPY